MLPCLERKAVLWEAYSLHLEEDESQAGKGTHWKEKNYTKVKWGGLYLLLMGITHSWATGIFPFPGLIPVFSWALQVCTHLLWAAANPKGAPSRLSWWNRQAFWVYLHINMHTHMRIPCQGPRDPYFHSLFYRFRHVVSSRWLQMQSGSGQWCKPRSTHSLNTLLHHMDLGQAVQQITTETREKSLGKLKE